MHKDFTQGFSAFLRRRHAQRHFQRRPLPGLLAPAHPQPARALARRTDATIDAAPAASAAATTASTAAATTQTARPSAAASELLATALEAPTAALERLQSRADGLDGADAARRLARDGPNDIAHEPPLPGWLHLWRCYLNPFNLLLTALAALSFVSADAKATVVIAAMVLLSTVIRFVQEGRSHRAAESLRALVSNTASVLRRREGLDGKPGAGPATGPNADGGAAHGSGRAAARSGAQTSRHAAKAAVAPAGADQYPAVEIALRDAGLLPD